MKHIIHFDHIGYAVRNIKKTAEYYIKSGWTLSEIFDEEIQHTKIAFLKKEGFPDIELVSPIRENEPSPLDNILQKIGCSTYHICYVVDDIDEAVEDLYDEGFKPLFEPVESVAMENRKICYLFHLHIGLIEVVSAK